MAAAYELGIKYWFESIAGWQNYYLSRQRWGVGYRNFQSLSPLMFRNYNDTLNYSILDLNYRLNPGIWSWDESWGLTFSSAQMSYNVFKTDMLGVGIFLGRSMPTWLDDVINYMPVFRKPKWVNIEYIYYPISQTTGISFYDLGSGYGNWILSASSKIMWTNQFFSELAIGMRQADFAQSFSDGLYTRQRFQFTSIYGSIALGANF
jgi:hypothetical protein